MDLADSLNSAGTGTDILRFIFNRANIKISSIFIHERDEDIRNRMILLVKNYSSSKVQFY